MLFWCPVHVFRKSGHGAGRGLSSNMNVCLATCTSVWQHEHLSGNTNDSLATRTSLWQHECLSSNMNASLATSMSHWQHEHVWQSEYLSGNMNVSLETSRSHRQHQHMSCEQHGCLFIRQLNKNYRLAVEHSMKVWRVNNMNVCLVSNMMSEW